MTPAHPTPTPSPNHPSTQPAPAPTPAVIRVLPWHDEVVDRLGHDPRSKYVETYWLGVLGPTTTWLLRRIADGFDRTPDGFELHTKRTADAMGIGMRQGRHSPFMRAIDRACQFHVARKGGDDTLQVRRRIPPVTQGQLRRLPDHLQSSHAEWQRAQLVAAGEEAERKARRLALTLLELGEDVDAAERQLTMWRIEPPMAQRALSWAHAKHHNALTAAEALAAAQDAS